MNSAVDLRVGQLGADQEFMITQYGSWFVNAAFGWPTLPAVDLPSGGPNYPLATPGVWLRVNPSGPLTWLLAAFNGDPAGPGLGNPQRRDATGALFRVSDGIFAISEVQYAINGDKDAKGPPVRRRVQKLITLSDLHGTLAQAWKRVLEDLQPPGRARQRAAALGPPVLQLPASKSRERPMRQEW